MNLQQIMSISEKIAINSKAYLRYCSRGAQYPFSPIFTNFPQGAYLVPSLNILMVEIGKILGEIGDKSGKICMNLGKTDFENPLM